MTPTNLLEVFFIAASPIVELRGAIPIAIKIYHIPWPFAFLIAFAGNLLPVPFLLLLLGPLSKLAGRIRVLGKMLDWIFERSRRQGGIVEKYKMIGLVLFVAVPLPGTGAWTGSIVAFLSGLGFRRAFLAIVAGVFLAGVIVTALTLIGWVGALIAGIGSAILIIHRLQKTT